MKCENCGTEIELGDFYCKKCGKPIQLVPDYNLLEEELLSRIVEDKSSPKAKFDSGVYFSSKKKNTVNKQKENRKQEPLYTSRLVMFWNSKYRNLCLFILSAFLFIGIISVIFAYIQGQSYDYKVKTAKEYDLKQKYTQALTLYQEAYDIKSDSIEAKTNLGIAYYHVKDYEKCTEYLSEVVNYNPDIALYTYLLEAYSAMHNERAIYELVSSVKSEEILNLISKYISVPPSFSVDSGDYTDDITLELTAPNDCDIFYTLDGKNPKISGKIYTKPLVLKDPSTMVKAITMNGSGKYSEIITKEYTIKYSKPSAPVVTPTGGVFTTPELITIQVPSNSDAYYTWDASTPTKKSFRYDKPFEVVPGHHILTVILIDDHGNESSLFKGDFNFISTENAPIP